MADVVSVQAIFTDDELLRSFSEELTGLKFWMDSNLDNAIAAMRRAQPDGIGFGAYFSPFFGRQEPYWACM